MTRVACLIVCLLCVAVWGWTPRRVLLRDVPSLTFRAGEMTLGRRGAPVPQLVCTNTVEQHTTPAVRCTNGGVDKDGEVLWICKGDFPADVKFQNPVVTCEGFAHRDDPYVLEGSCGLEYELAAHEPLATPHKAHIPLSVVLDRNNIVVE